MTKLDMMVRERKAMMGLRNHGDPVAIFLVNRASRRGVMAEASL